MPFGTITSQTISYEPRRPGIYQRAGLPIGSPADEFRFSGASSSAKSKKLSVSLTRLREKDFVAPGTVLPSRETILGTLNLQFPTSGAFTSAEVISLIADFSTALTAAVLNRMAAGEI